MRILEMREGSYQEKCPECDANLPLSASSVTFYQNFSWESCLQE